jgi:hypothetical protein
MKLSLQEEDMLFSQLEMLDAFALENVSKEEDFSREGLSIHEVHRKARNVWQKDPSFVDRYIASNEALKDDEIALLKSWRGITRSLFVVLACYPKYAIFFSAEGCMFYEVLAIEDGFYAVLGEKPPVVIETSLLPFKNKIVWDGLIGSTEIAIEKSVASAMLKNYEKAKKIGFVITSLAS